MSNGVAAYQTGAYRVATDVYEGPLDLLLQLIERAELDITKLALAQVTDQYLAYLRGLSVRYLSERAAEEVSAFLVIAARLLQIKSEALLPRPPVLEPGEEDAGESLARQLQTYKKFKAIALFLDRRQEEGLCTYLRLAPSPHLDARADLSGVMLHDLVEAARAAFTAMFEPERMAALEDVVTAPKVTIRQKINLIADLLRQRERASFFSMLDRSRSRLDIVVTFLAVLELVKLHFVKVYQNQLFGDILVEPTDAWGISAELELEFGE
jgi:segregation and condensation protein A